jgi:HK97 gp10 family phage protein
MSLQVSITGHHEIMRKLSRLPEEMRKKTEMIALRDAMKPTAKAVAAKAAAIKDTGLLSKSIGLSVRKQKKKGLYQGTYSARVGPRTGFKVSKGTRVAKKTKKSKKGKLLRTKGQSYEYFQDPVKYAHLVELGTSHSAAKPFIRPGIAQTESGILNRLASGYDRGLSLAIKNIK